MRCNQQKPLFNFAAFAPARFLASRLSRQATATLETKHLYVRKLDYGVNFKLIPTIMIQKISSKSIS